MSRGPILKGSSEPKIEANSRDRRHSVTRGQIIKNARESLPARKILSWRRVYSADADPLASRIRSRPGRIGNPETVIIGRCVVECSRSGVELYICAIGFLSVEKGIDIAIQGFVESAAEIVP
jgi:hypothetical protein